ncbi:DnaJ domain-containing protein [candidate division KSB1 bacterium]|nr:DnaJ domain-containing protein [candidate division KSB1 bacterium]NIR71491.1 DnaJ domain-containing protein [candidate division KSB1 bacterium]NIS23412.1 DnaJ domain-containing protein [candidate division KSB1 bacterium]NIT70303.1 DnaJ domain-containing protein [candidate division KSB1 bacterium]NIU24026.1 DnaJ domain-containing protein [candidate division KSB1 bacterium]
MANKDYYQILGVNENASSEDIKKAYRSLAKEYHPDAHPGDKESEQRFKEISEAYSVLNDPKKRQQYDQVRRFGYSGARPGDGYQSQGFDFDLSDLFEGSTGGRRRSYRRQSFNLDDFFGFGGIGDLFSQIFEREGGFGQSAHRTQRATDIHANLQVPFETAVKGGKTVFSINKEGKCSRCKGTGSKGGKKPDTCPECHGSGMLSQAQGAFAVNRPCPRCMGKGQIIREACDVCGGTGHVMGEKKYSINIEPGVENGKKLRLKGEGAPGMNGTASGDLILTINVAKHRFFRKEGLDIYCEIPIDKERLKKGTTLKVKTVYGNSVKLNIPADTEPGKTFRLKGMGIKSKNKQGDQYVKVKPA